MMILIFCFLFCCTLGCNGVMLLVGTSECFVTTAPCDATLYTTVCPLCLADNDATLVGIHKNLIMEDVFTVNLWDVLRFAYKAADERVTRAISASNFLLSSPKRRWDGIELLSRLGEAFPTDGRPWLALARAYRRLKMWDLCFNAAIEAAAAYRVGVFEIDAADEASVCASYSSHRYSDSFLILDRMAMAGEKRERVKKNHALIVGGTMRRLSLSNPAPQLRFASRFKNVIIVDDFLANPSEVRDFALGKDFTVKGNYPGRRLTGVFSTSYVRRQLEEVVGAPIDYWPGHYNGAIQIASQGNKSWVHSDPTTFAGVLYLTPNAPADAGTQFFRHKQTLLEFPPDEAAAQARNVTLRQLEEVMAEPNLYQNWSQWELIDSIGNKFNRLVLFNGLRYHSTLKYFGDTDETARLFVTFFFSVKRPALL